MPKKLTKIYADGGARGNPGPGAAAFIVIQNNKVIHSGSKLLGKTTNNYAEYTGVFIALKWLIEKSSLDSDEIVLYLDSELVVKQLSGKYKVKSKNLRPLIIQIKNLENDYTGKVSYRHIPRSKNKLADHLVNKALDEKSDKFHVHN